MSPMAHGLSIMIIIIRSPGHGMDRYSSYLTSELFQKRDAKGELMNPCSCSCPALCDCDHHLRLSPPPGFVSKRTCMLHVEGGAETMECSLAVFLKPPPPPSPSILLSPSTPFFLSLLPLVAFLYLL